MIRASIEAFIQDPENHDIVSILKGARNGLVYGARLRFCHALVMSVLFRTGPLDKRLAAILKATRDHATALGKFVLIYKTVVVVARRLRGAKTSVLSEIGSHSHAMDAFWGGLIGGYLVFGRNSPSAALSSINQQMVLYVFSRVVIALGKLLAQRLSALPELQSQLGTQAWMVTASLSWALVMYLFRRDPSLLQHSMLHSMRNLYVDSETFSGLDDFI